MKEELPDGSIVARAWTAWIRLGIDAWKGTDGSRYSDKRIQELLDTDAVVVRRGTQTELDPW